MSEMAINRNRNQQMFFFQILVRSIATKNLDNIQLTKIKLVHMKVARRSPENRQGRTTTTVGF